MSSKNPKSLPTGSLIDNIRFGQPDASQEEVERVARIAGIHEVLYHESWELVRTSARQ